MHNPRFSDYIQPFCHPELPWLWIGTFALGGEGLGPSRYLDRLSVLSDALDHGVRCFDTAGFYSHGDADRLLAKAIGTRRSEVMISSKGGLFWSGKKVTRMGTAQALRGELYETLDRLGTDYLDLFSLHWPDFNVPISDSIEALKLFQKEGLIRYYGIGNLNADVLSELEGIDGLPFQFQFNVIHQDHDLLKVASRLSLFNCVYSPLAQGLLGDGRSAKGRSFLGNKDVRQRNLYFRSALVQDWLQTFRRLSQDVPTYVWAYIWLFSHTSIDVCIMGPRTSSQLKRILGLNEWISDLGLQGSGPVSWTSVLSLGPYAELWDHLSQVPDPKVLAVVCQKSL